MTLKRKNRKQLLCAAIALLLCLVCAACGRTVPVYFDGERALGIDVSSHNGEIDWEAVSKAEVQYAFIRVGYRGYGDEGVLAEDELAAENMTEAAKHDIPVGVYFYSQAVNEDEAREEAEFAVKAIRHHTISLPVVIDIEYAHASDGSRTGRLYEAGLSADEMAAICNAFADVVREEGYTPMVYSNSYIFTNHMNMEALDDDIQIWLADYNDSVTYSGAYQFHQFTKQGQIDGINSKQVDLNYWYAES